MSCRECGGRENGLESGECRPRVMSYTRVGNANYTTKSLSCLCCSFYAVATKRCLWYTHIHMLTGGTGMSIHASSQLHSTERYAGSNYNQRGLIAYNNLLGKIPHKRYFNSLILGNNKFICTRVV